MTRPLRIEFKGAVYHITSRGNTIQTIFLDIKKIGGGIKSDISRHDPKALIGHCKGLSY